MERRRATPRRAFYQYLGLDGNYIEFILLDYIRSIRIDDEDEVNHINTVTIEYMDGYKKILYLNTNNAMRRFSLAATGQINRNCKSK